MRLERTPPAEREEGERGGRERAEREGGEREGERQRERGEGEGSVHEGVLQ